MTKILTVIPARGGSKSIPRKNIKYFRGLPLIQYSIDYSLKSNLVEQTLVSTDDKEIAKVSQNLGAEVPFLRPVRLADDDVQDFPVFEHALINAEQIYKKQFDLVVLLRPTSPLRPKGLIEKGVELLLKNKQASSLRSVTCSLQHPYRQWYKDGDFIRGFVENQKNIEPYNLPRQKLQKLFFQSGDIEIIKRETILSGSISGKNVIPLLIDQKDVHDIDSYSDFINAERKDEK
tara:strand:- start:140 stop:838 length:699 start_codon:yes stop_codon:yes gene_type:complete